MENMTSAQTDRKFVGKSFATKMLCAYYSRCCDSRELFAGVYMTGILPIKKYGHESAVSDFYEYSMLEPRPLQEYIGFTAEEVKNLC